MKRLFYFCTLLLFYPVLAEAQTYYVRTGGLDSHNCTQAQTDNDANAKQTIPSALACIGATAGAGAGKTVIVHTGTYTQALTEANLGTPFMPSGTSGNPFTLKAFGSTATGSGSGPDGELVTIRAPGGAGNLRVESGQDYWVVQGFTFDGINLGASSVGNDNIKISSNSVGVQLLHNAIINSQSENAVYLGDSTNFLIAHNSIHDGRMYTESNSQGANHCIYTHASNSIFEYNEIYNCGGWGIHQYTGGGAWTPSGNIYRFNKIYDWGRQVASGFSSDGFLMANGIANAAYANLVYIANPISGTGSYGINIWDTGDSVYNNTVYGVSGYGIQQSNGGNTTTFVNNISFNPGATDMVISSGTPATNNYNYCRSGCLGANTINSTTSPFISAPSNFALATGLSPTAIGTGTPPNSPFNASPYNVDFAGVTRPQGGSWDIGAYESGGAPSCPAVSPALVASYSFEGNGADSTGRGHTAILGSGWSYTGSGKIGQGALSTGVSGITVADHNELDPCAAYTYEGWINLPNTSGDYAFINKNPDSKAFLFASIFGYCGSGVPMGGYAETTLVVACSTTALTPGFKHLAVTYDSTLGSANVKLYLNGVQVSFAHGSTLLSATTGSLQFCTSSFGETCPSGTIVDEIRIYNYARSASEILSSVTSPPVFTIKLQVSSLKIGPSVNLKVGVP